MTRGAAGLLHVVRVGAVVAAVAIGALGSACGSRERDDHERPQVVQERERAPESLLPGDLHSRPDTALLRNTKRAFDTDDEGQPDSLPTLPERVTLGDIRTGDRLFHRKGGCVNCHGAEVQGLAGRGSSMTNGLHLIPSEDQRGIDSIIVNGIRDAETRSPIAMPPRGQHGDLSTEETHAISAYVWAVANAHGEPWPGGHRLHSRHAIDGSARTLIP